MTRRDAIAAFLVLSVVALLVAALIAVPGPRGANALAADPSCQRSRGTVVIDLDNDRHGAVLRHAWFAIRRDDQPEHLTVARAQADRNRQASLRNWPTRTGFDRDEYPPAVSDQGGAGAHVRYVRSSVNRSAGAVMGAQLRPYCDGQRFRYERRP